MVMAFIERFEAWCGSRALAWIIAINIVVSLLLMLGNVCGYLFHFSIAPVISFLALSANLQQFIYTPWTCISYMFVQLNFLHLLFNMLWLCWFGPILVSVGFERRIVWLYLGAGISGAASFIICRLLTGIGGILIGSSAAVLGIMTAVAVAAPNMEMRFFLIGNIRLKWLAPLCILLAFLGNAGNAAGMAAHAGGILYGLIYALIVAGKINERNYPRYNEYDEDSKQKSFIDIFRKSKKPTKISYNPNHRPDPEGVKNFARAAEGRLADMNRLDELLDKIRTSGYDSLSDAQRRELNALSKRLNK